MLARNPKKQLLLSSLCEFGFASNFETPPLIETLYQLLHTSSLANFCGTFSLANGKLPQLIPIDQKGFRNEAILVGGSTLPWIGFQIKKDFLNFWDIVWDGFLRHEKGWILVTLFCHCCLSVLIHDMGPLKSAASGGTFGRKSRNLCDQFVTRQRGTFAILRANLMCLLKWGTKAHT